MGAVVTLKKNEDRRITAGHLWAFSNELLSIEGDPQAGELVELKTHAGVFLGIGIYNPHSLIAVRLLTREREEIDFHFFQKRIQAALELRRMLFGDADAYRLVHGESDFLPGLIVDVYGRYISLQAFSYGMDKRLTLICDVLESLLHPKGIIERNEAQMRSLEELLPKRGVLRGTADVVEIREHGISYAVDLLEGQKTGFFLDQRENRFAIRRYARGTRALDCCCNDGGFALNVAAAGAAEVTGIDVSETAVRNARSNAERNNLQDRAKFHAADMFEYLGSAAVRGEKYDLINLDPPSFAKNKKGVVRAKRGYRDLHTAAIKVLKSGGILATASCSHHIDDATFLQSVADPARSLRRSLTLLEWRGASPDHPVLPAMPETHYLKFGVFRVS
jgi:23S rRNA (cytosine1962-C5)-methyltransferase